MKSKENILNEINLFENWLIDTRRHLHTNPELSEKEYQTQAFIIKNLKEMNISFKKIADTGVMATLIGEKNGPVLALRADIDALPMQDEKNVSYSSSKKNICHACGHDAHTTIALGVLKFFSNNLDLLKGTLKVFFQPAEETVGGAKRMVQEGCMENPNVDYVIGKHVMPYLEAGEVEIKYGKLNAASNGIKIVITGLASHGAYPEQGIDALLAASSVIQNIHTVVSRQISPLDSAVISLGTITGGTKQNTICDKVIITGTMRTTDPIIRKNLKIKLKTIVKNTALAFNATGEIFFSDGYDALINNDSVVSIMQNVFSKTLEDKKIHIKEAPSMGVEDFSFFLNKAKGAFYHLGCGNKSKCITSPTHSTTFDIDESCLKLGVYLDCNLLLTLMDK